MAVFEQGPTVHNWRRRCVVFEMLEGAVWSHRGGKVVLQRLLVNRTNEI
jgi:hypothetical protein